MIVVFYFIYRDIPMRRAMGWGRNQHRRNHHPHLHNHHHQQHEQVESQDDAWLPVPFRQARGWRGDLSVAYGGGLGFENKDGWEIGKRDRNRPSSISFHLLNFRYPMGFRVRTNQIRVYYLCWSFQNYRVKFIKYLLFFLQILNIFH